MKTIRSLPPLVPVPHTDRSCLTVAEMIEQFSARFRNAGANDLAARLESASRPLPVIRVFERARYGETDVWPADEAQARLLFNLTGNRTLTQSHLNALKQLGFTFAMVADPTRVRRATVPE